MTFAESNINLFILILFFYLTYNFRGQIKGHSHGNYRRANRMYSTSSFIPS